MMKKLFFLIPVLAVLATQVAQAQILEPVKWSFSVKMLENNEADIVAKCTIENKWHVYALKVSDDPDAPAIPTSLELEKSKSFKAVGSPREGKFITHFDPNFEMELNYFENAATFTQRIQFSSEAPFVVKGTVNYMSCDDSRCIFPEPESFSLKITPNVAGKSQEPPPGQTEELPAEKTEASTIGQGDTGFQETGAMEIYDPVEWSFAVAKISEGMFDVSMEATIEEGWHIYSQVLESNEGPVATSFSFDPVDGVEFKGPVKEGTPIVHYDANFMMNLSYYETTARFVQPIAVEGNALPSINGTLQYMVCNDEMCLPPRDVKFRVNLETGKGYEITEEGVAVESDAFVLPGVDLDNPVNSCGQEKRSESLWAIFLFGIIGGLLALLTPCVFPMIPLTVSFFTKGSEAGKGKQRAMIYGFFILLIYFILSLPFHLSKNIDPEVLNGIATNAWLNIAFFVIFIVFAISFFGFFEITLPSGLANRADKASNVGGLIGIFFMALTLAIVSFSCTGPILGSVIGSIYASDVTGEVSWLGMNLSLPAAKVSSAMLGFGLSLGAPFALFAGFPGMLKKLPKSGGWLQDFKVSLGFLEVAFALKFISNSDLVEQWGLIKREMFFAIWIVIGIFWVLYLLGRFSFKKGYSSTTRLKGFKLVITLLIAVFTVRMVPGLFPPSEWNRFDFLSGFPPPKFYSYYHYEEEFKIYRDLDEAMAVAMAEKKPIFLDFTGWACVNCRKMEDTVWPQDQVKEILAREYVMVSLYVDEKGELPAEQQFLYETRDGRKKQIKTVGNKWATLQTETFNNNSQPYYALLSPDGKLLAPPRQYDADVAEYAKWLNCGLNAFETARSSDDTAMK